jgi:Double zinc ribbon
MEYMTRKCGSCGIPAPNDRAKFCNDCGSTIVDVPDEHFPVCDSCGDVVSDTLAQFCDKCGAPVRPACPSCGNKAINKDSKFCTRCGTVFATASARPAQQPVAPAPSVVMARRRTTPPVPEEPVPVAQPEEWDPWSDGSEEFDALPVPAPQEEKRYAHLPLMADEPGQARTQRAPQISMAQKKYGHLPLVADELKGLKPAYQDPGDVPEPSRKGRPPDKKGLLGFLKK